MTQKEMFAEKSDATKSCERCGRLCRIGPPSDSQYFKRGTAETGKYCANCLMTYFVKNTELGPASALGADRINEIFPAALRLPNIQEQMNHIASFGDAPVCEVDWETVIDNWGLPFAGDQKKKRRRD